MKKDISILLFVLLTSLSASAQGIVGKWKSEEMTVGDGMTGAITWVFETSGKAYMVINLSTNIQPTVGDLKLTYTVPGYYYLEGGKALTLNFDREKMTVKSEIAYIPDLGKYFAAEKIPVLKQKMEELTRDVPEKLKSKVMYVVQPSEMRQILYNDGNKFVIANPRNNFWKVRDELTRVGD